MGKSVFLLKFICFVIVVIIASWLTQTHYPTQVIEQSLPYWMLACLIAGMFYTSFLTVPFALIAFYILSQHVDPIPLILLGGSGAMIGDLFIVSIMRKVFVRFSSVKHLTPFFKMLGKRLHNWHLNYLAVILGCIIIASPFPDEFGLILMGASGISYPKLMVASFIANTIGVALIVAPAYLLL